ncbi:hypothetical protein ACF0H5_022198 [Mactra antiquata]
MNSSNFTEVANISESDSFNRTTGDALDNYDDWYAYMFYVVNIAYFAAQKQPELRMAVIVTYKYLLPIIWAISLIGNSIIICVLLRKKNRNHSMSVYLASLALADLGVNTNNNLLKFLVYKGLFPEPMTDVDCLRDTFSIAIVMIAAWMLVLVSIERFVIVMSPIKGKQYCTVKLARIACATTWILFIGFGMIFRYIFFEHVHWMGKHHVCFVKDYVLDLHNNYIVYILMALKFYIPYVIIFFSTTYISVQLLTRKIRKSASRSNQSKSVNVVLIIVNLIYIITQSPYTFLWLATDDLQEDMTRVERFAYEYYVLPLAIIVGDINSAVNVFVYFLTGSRFRNDAIEMFSELIPKSWKKKTPRKIQQHSDGGVNTKSTDGSFQPGKDSLHM